MAVKVPLLLVFLFVHLCASLTIPEFNKTTSYSIVPKSSLDKEYKLEYFSKATWFNAHLSCLNCGMKLATINSQEEQNYVVQLIKEYGLTDQQFWLSGTDLAFEGRFSWFTNGNIFQYTNWLVNQPDNAQGNEHCVQLRSISNYTWNDRPCSDVFYFICERMLVNDC